MAGAKSPSVLRVAIDTGGTFTDCVWAEGGGVRVLKTFSTPGDPSEAIAAALKKILEVRVPHPSPLLARVGKELRLLHGTTVGTNALLEHKGARVAFVTTAGFEDAIEIGRQARLRLYDFFFDRVAPLVAGDMRFGVDERTGSDGSILRAPSAAELKRVAAAVKRARPEAVAVSLLFSFANPRNEQAVGAALARALPGVPLSLSHQVLPEFREYERASTVVVNAALQPIMQRYLERLARVLGGPHLRSRCGKSSIFVMQSSGGITSLASAAREPVRTVLSGPAGGVVGASAMARRSGCERILSFDMGGTSTDVALAAGRPRAMSEGEVAGLPVRVPMLDIHIVGAGGGSIARFDAAGALRVGPESAGADPGPICYGRGEAPTVTDANLLLGRLRPEQFLGGEFTPDVARTRRLVESWLRQQRSHLSVEEFAAGVVRVVNATMEKALRVVSIERGYDPREFALVAFGGAGGMHACELAAALGIPRVLVPPLPGALSAYGILVSDIVKDYSRTIVLRVAPASTVTLASSPAGHQPPWREIELRFTELERAARQAFRAEGWRGTVRMERSADLRYHGQGYELNIPLTGLAGGRLLRDFAAAHQQRYGYLHRGREIEIVTLRVRARMPARNAGVVAYRVGGRQSPATKLCREPVFFGRNAVPTAIHERDALTPMKTYSGPAVITEYSATTVVPPGMKFKIDRAGAINIQIA